MRCKIHGFSLQELILVLLILAIATALTVPKLLNASGNRAIVAKTATVLQEVQGTLRISDADIGDKASFGPGKILSKFSKYRQIDPAILSTTPSSGDPNIGPCPSGKGNSQLTFQRNDGIVITNVSNTWLDDSFLDGSNLKGDAVCVALRGANSTQLGKDAFWMYLPRRAAMAIITTNNSSSSSTGTTTCTAGVSGTASATAAGSASATTGTTATTGTATATATGLSTATATCTATGTSTALATGTSTATAIGVSGTASASASATASGSTSGTGTGSGSGTTTSNPCSSGCKLTCPPSSGGCVCQCDFPY